MSSDHFPTEEELLDQEIATLKDQAAVLRKNLIIESSTILSAASTQSLLKPSAISRGPKGTDPASSNLIAESEKQRAYIQQSLHRICSSVTSFKVHDPDPNAVDGGHVLGLRFEVLSQGRFLRPYYVMLNRPYPGSKHLRIHRHTLPPAIPLAGLAARHLPPQRSGSDESAEHDLGRFARTLRREIVRYHNRLGVSADLRRGLGLHEQTAENLTANDIVEVGIADIEAKQIRFTWADERSGRVVMDDDGKVLKLMVFGKQGRDWETTKELYGNYDRIEDVAKRLREYVQR
ncbi:hypothetical protein QQZ08_012535 [Neonectria magnoliae]|uniref:Cenp-O kinetochore centromere component n=1 Tax=Neonectria magnoliae TaxID=2732573 RepID=A0ABR1H089_9HYPO